MESNILKEEASDKKPLNIVLLGDDSSEKEKLMSKFILLNSPQFQENEAKVEEDKEEDISVFQNIIHCIEIHGEKLRMKFWDNPSTDEFLSPSIKIAQGILLFYSVKDRKSYEKIKNDLSKIIELGRFDIPIIVIGNHKTSPERQVTYEEAKTWADNYGLRFYETSIEKDGSIKEILQDIGEQLLFQECIFSANNSKNNSVVINEEEKDEIFNLEENLNIGSLIESKKKESDKKVKKGKNGERNSISYIDKEEIHKKSNSSFNLLDKDNQNLNKKKDKKIYKINSSSNFKKIKPKSKANKTKEENYLTKNSSGVLNTDINIKNNYNTLDNQNSHKISKYFNNSKANIINKTKNLFKKNQEINPSKTSNYFHSKKNSINSLNLSSSNSNIHSYLKKTTLIKNREKEVKEKKIKIQKESQTINSQKEREGLELKKKKNLEDKENYLKKIKEDKILQKEKEKKKKEEEIKTAKNNYDKLKQEKEIITQEKKIEKEKDKLNKIALKQSEKEKLNKRVEEINKAREKEIENMKIKKLKEKEKEKIKEEENEEKMKSSTIKSKLKKTKEKNSVSPNKHKKENSAFNLSFNSKLKPDSLNSIDKTRKDTNKSNQDKEKEINEKISSFIIEKEKGNDSIEEIKTKEELKNIFINNQNNEDIYRCLKCNSIPKIIFNESNQEIEVFCDNSRINNFHHNITSYQNFQTKSLDHSLYENTFCYFCNKSLNKLETNDMIYFCPLCQFFFCSKDQNVHLKQKHQNEIDVKNIYKSSLEKKIVKRRGSVEIDTSKKLNQNIVNSARKLSFKNNSRKPELKKVENKPQEIKTIAQKEMVKIPIYLLDTFCIYHDETYNSYCHNCQKNICNKCKEKDHMNHLIINFEDIMLNDVELSKKKLELNMLKENLSKISEYFMALIEAIKCRFEKLYKAKQKEIEIKEKIIKDYENIKYNYNCILNIKNLNLRNKQNFINSNNNINWLERLNLIFEYLNSPLISEKGNIFRELNSNSKYNINNVYFHNEKIKNIIKLNRNDIALVNNKSELKIYDVNNLEEKVGIKLFKGEKGINQILKLKSGELICCGYEHIKKINFDLNNNISSIENIINEKNNNFLSLIELNNNYLITSDTSKKIRLWKMNKNKYYHNLNMVNDVEINLLYDIDNHAFIGYSNNEKKIIKYLISKNNEIVKQNELGNISINIENNSLIKYDSNYLFINYKENNNFGIMIVILDKFEIIKKISNMISLYFINNCNWDEKERIITIDENGIIQKWKFSKSENKIYECDKMKIYNNTLLDGKLTTFIEINDDIFLFKYENKIIKYTKNNICS